MANMAIDNFETTADLFTLPNNPRVFSDETTAQGTIL
jgi:hypothetical protein